jgi:tetratricopeptide (TPR) repeat protein
MLLRELALSHARLGGALHDLGLLDEALVNLRKSLALREGLRRQLDENPAVLSEVADLYSAIGDMARELGRAEEANQAAAALVEYLTLLDMRQHPPDDTPDFRRRS